MNRKLVNRGSLLKQQNTHSFELTVYFLSPVCLRDYFEQLSVLPFFYIILKVFFKETLKKHGISKPDSN